MNPKEIEKEAWGLAIVAGIMAWIILDSFVWAMLFAVLVFYFTEHHLKKKHESDDE